MAIIFSMTGVCGFLISCFAYKIPEIRMFDKS